MPASGLADAALVGKNLSPCECNVVLVGICDVIICGFVGRNGVVLWCFWPARVCVMSVIRGVNIATRA